MDDDDEIPLGLSKEEWAAMVADAERREAASKKRSETRKAHADAEKAARLARPPVDLDEAWRRHADTCPHPSGSNEASAWSREHHRFAFDGTTWRRERTFQKTNSGKGERLRSVVYYGDDGREVTTFDAGPNRRNDEDRNFGLHE
ncbi:hypothetical protein ACFPYM_16745 [Methylobacterium hispanicum]|uniref:hypothetical protein n=1 Tax=Methylobacterium hispanicum TaxID=270350 RepID=UPI001EE0120C|nr:hypothetical protein [Methylobacterium hispanicum]